MRRRLWLTGDVKGQWPMIAEDEIDFHALLTDEYVAIANRGRPFTRQGLRAVCQAHISPKGEDRITPITDELDAVSFLNEIRKQRLAAYASCPSDLLEHSRAEHVLRREYAGRILLELLQNAHDAIAAEPIGSKGVGFKAVLNVCEGPRIHSGALHCGFDRQRSREEFRDAGFLHDNEAVPLMRLPFPVSVTDEPRPVRDLIAKFDTVVLLPFVRQNAGKRFLEEWIEYAGDATLLLFLPSLGRIVWERSDRAGASKREWSCKRGPEVVEIRDCDNLDLLDRWRLSSSPRASVALRLGREGPPVRERNYPNIRVFFETDEKSPLPILIHADFPLKEGRANVLIEDEASGADVHEVSQAVAHLARAALAEVHDPGFLLDLLSPRVAPEEMGRIERELWNALKNAIASLDIPGAGGLRLDKVRLRPTDESRKTSWRSWFDCDLWNSFKEVLSDHREEQLAGLFFLPAGIDTDEREKTILHFNPGARLTVEELLALPLLPVAGGHQPVASGKSNVFFPPKTTPPSPPPGIEVRFLKQHFVQGIKDHEKSGDLRKLLIGLLVISKFEPLNLIKKAILPVLREGRQPDGLLGFLSCVIAPALQNEDLIFDWLISVRRELTESLKIPLRNGRELPAAQVYAGADWTGNDFLERAYGNRDDRGFLQPPPVNKEERERWERFYRWVGVGWHPKVLPIVCFTNKIETFEGPMWKDGTFPVNHEPQGWREYCGKLDDFYMESRKSRLRRNWTLDGGGSVLLQAGALSVFSDNWGYYAKYRNAIFSRSSNLRADYDNEIRTGPSHLIWLFQTNPWIPVKGVSENQDPRDVFARPEIVLELGGWGFDLDGNANENLLKAIGVRSRWREIRDEDWRRWLERSNSLSEDKFDQDNTLRYAVRNLYEAALRHWPRPQNPSGGWIGPIWCVERRDDNTEVWRQAANRRNVFFVDRPYLDELRLPGLWVFPIRLNRLENTAKERFKLQLLSEHLSGQPEEPIAQLDTAQKRVQGRIDERLPLINAYLETAYQENPRCVQSSDLPSIEVLEELKICFRLQDEVVGNGFQRDAYYSPCNGSWTLWLDGSLFDETGGPATSVWEYVASAIVCSGNFSLDTQPCLKDLLLYEGQDLTRKLINLGVTKETVDRIVPNVPAIPVTAEPNPGIKEPIKSSQEPENEGNGTVVDPIIPRTSSGSGSRGGSPGVAIGRPRPPSAVQPGREAQEWMRDELRQRLGSEGWRISDAPTHDEELRETDIELHHDQFGTFHVEVKHSETDRVFWSENEVEKAKENTGHYFMVILTRDKEKHFEEYWVDDPLQDLKDLPRTGVWEWRGREDGISLERADATWSIPAPKPERPAAGFSFKLEIKGTWLKTYHADFEAVKDRMTALSG
jgi:hypothetical protein